MAEENTIVFKSEKLSTFTERGFQPIVETFCSMLDDHIGGHIDTLEGKSIQQLTDNDIWDGDPSLWGTGLNTTIAYVETWWDASEGMLRDRIICRRPAVTPSTGPGIGEITVTWPSLEGRTYRVEYSDDLITWQVAAESVPSVGYGETSWTDGPTSGTIPPPSEVSRRFYRVCENE